MIKKVYILSLALSVVLFSFNTHAACLVNYDKAGSLSPFPKNIEISKEKTTVNIISNLKSKSLQDVFFAHFETSLSLKNNQKKAEKLNLGALVSYTPSYEGIKPNVKFVQSNLGMSITVNGKKVPFVTDIQKIPGTQGSLELYAYNFQLNLINQGKMNVIKVAYKIPLVGDGRVLNPGRSLVVFSCMDIQPKRKASFSVNNKALKNDSNVRLAIANKMLSPTVLKNAAGLFWNHEVAQVKYNKDFDLYMPIYSLELMPYTKKMLTAYLKQNDGFHQVPRESVQEVKDDLLAVYKNIAQNGLNKGKFDFAFTLLKPAQKQ